MWIRLLSKFFKKNLFLQGSNPRPLHLKHRVLTTGLLAKSYVCSFHSALYIWGSSILPYAAVDCSLLYSVLLCEYTIKNSIIHWKKNIFLTSYNYLLIRLHGKNEPTNKNYPWGCSIGKRHLYCISLECFGLQATENSVHNSINKYGFTSLTRQKVLNWWLLGWCLPINGAIHIFNIFASPSWVYLLLIFVFVA